MMNAVTEALRGVLGKYYRGDSTEGCANDVVVVRTRDGVMRSTPFHVQFLASKEAEANSRVAVSCNGSDVDGLGMELDAGWRAMFPAFIDTMCGDSDEEPPGQAASASGEDLLVSMLREGLSPRSAHDDDAESLSSFSSCSFDSQLSAELQTELAEPDPRHAALARRERSVSRTAWARSEHLRRFSLGPGRNTVTFSGAGQHATARVYLWESSAKVVLVNVDGVLDSDQPAQHAPLLGKISGNGYKFLYLSAKRGMLDGPSARVALFEAGLPDGPVIFCPHQVHARTGLPLSSRAARSRFFLHCAHEAQSLLAQDAAAPMFAGFGNTASDLAVFQAVGIPAGRRFPLKSSTQGPPHAAADQADSVASDIGRCGAPRSSFGSKADGVLVGERSYFSFCVDISEVVDFAFPPSVCQSIDNYSSFNFWRITANVGL